MNSNQPQVSAALNRFLREYLADRESGGVLPLAEYQRRFPGFEDAIAAEYERLGGGDSSGTAEHSSGGDALIQAQFPGGHVGPYRLEHELGRGAQGVVYRARDTRLGRTVALKLLTGLSALSPEHLARLHREAALAARLDHPGLCTVYESDSVVGSFSVPYVAMRFVEGTTLARRIRERSARRGKTAVSQADIAGPSRADIAGPSRAEIDWALRYTEAAARALHVAHGAGVVHRDIKPANLMVDPSGKPVVLDFGVARDLEGGGSISRTGDLLGTPAYMAPEQIEGGRVDRRADVYSLGATLFELLTGEPPFKAPTREALYRKILVERAPDPRGGEGSLERRLVSGDLAVVLATALEKDPERRYQSAEHFADDLAAVLESRPIAARPVRTWTRLARWMKREPGQAALAGALVLALTLAAGLWGNYLARRPAILAGERELALEERRNIYDRAFGGRASTVDEARLVEALAQEPVNGSIRFTLVKLHIYRGEFDAALEVLDAAPESTDQVRGLERLRVSVLGFLGRAEEAAELEAELGDALDPHECWWLARLARQRGDEAGMQEARDLLERAILLAPEANETYYHDLMLVASYQEDMELIRTLEQALERNYARSPMSWFYIAMARASLYPGQTPEDRAPQVEALERALELDPDFAQALTLLASVKVHNGELDDAFALHERALGNLTGGVREERTLRWSFANVLLQASEPEEALAEVDRALAVEPDEVPLLAMRARALLVLEREDEVRATYGRILELDPEHEAAGEYLSEPGAEPEPGDGQSE